MSSPAPYRADTTETAPDRLAETGEAAASLPTPAPPSAPSSPPAAPVAAAFTPPASDIASRDGAGHRHVLDDLVDRGSDEIVERWTRAVRADRRVPSTRELSDPVLRDSVPGVLREILHVLADEDASVKVRAACVFQAKEHGQVRAGQHFAIDELVREYQVLREQLFQYLEERVADDAGVTPRETLDFCRRIGRALDEALRVTTQSFLDSYTHELRELSQTDSLTGLLNHGTFFDRLDEEVARAGRRGTPLAVALVDLDLFKEVNEARGHQFGDRLLRRVGEVMRHSLRGGDVVCRYGGDEFGLILPRAGRADAETMLTRLVEAVLAAAREMEVPEVFGLSHGIAELGADGADPEALVAAADHRLGDEKRDRRRWRPDR